MDPAVVPLIHDLAAELYPQDTPEIVFAPTSFEHHGHFAGTDAARAQAFLEVANDPGFDALWFGRGGYGSVRIWDLVKDRLEPAARDKAYLGYSDAGTILAGLYGLGFPALAHGPMPQEIAPSLGRRDAVARSLRWLVERDPSAVEPSVAGGPPAAAFNLMILSSLVGTPIQPDLTGHVLMIEEIDEYLYRIDRAFGHVTANEGIRKVAGLRLGRCTVLQNPTADFGMSVEEVARFWCERSGIAFLGEADIGHDGDNRVVPFGLRP